jgi:hypothetical protein
VLQLAFAGSASASIRSTEASTIIVDATTSRRSNECVESKSPSLAAANYVASAALTINRHSMVEKNASGH